MLQRPKVGFEPDRRLFAMGVGAQTVRLWELDRGEDEQAPVGELETDRIGMAGVAVVGDRLVTIHETGLIAGWDVESIRDGHPETSWSVETDLVVSEVAIERTGSTDRLIGVGGEKGEIVVGRLEAGDQPRLTSLGEAHGDQIEVLEFSEQHGLLATAGRDREIAVWSSDTDTDQPFGQQRRLTGLGGWPLSISFGDNGRRLASGCMDNGVYFWDLEAEQPLRESRFEHHGWVEDVRWADGDRALLSGSWDNTVGVFDGETMQPVFQFMYHDDYVAAVLPVPGTSLVFAGSYDGDVTVWDWRHGELEAVLEGHRDWVIGLEWLGDGLVASVSSDETARLWSVDELASAGSLGQPAVSDFELGGGFDLTSFGVEEDRGRLGDESAMDRDVMRSKVVRTFDSEGAGQAESQNPAMSMLESALDSVPDVEADDVEPDPDTGDFEPEEALDEVESEQTGVGDEISSLVRDAISDTEEVEPEQPVEADQEAGGAVDVEESPGEADPGESPQEGPGDQQEAMDLLDVPEMDTASAQDLDEQGPDETSGVDGDSWSDDEVGADRGAEAYEDVDPDVDAEEDFPDVDDLADQAFDDVRDDVDIMDSTFDAPSSSGEQGDEESVPTSGPDYDPQPVETDDDISDVLPDEDELEEAFSSSVSETLGEESGPGESSGDDSSKERDVDRPPGDRDGPPDDQGEPSGKVEPSSAKRHRDHGADGGDDNPWDRQQRATTSTRGKPLPASGETSRSGEADSGPEQDDQKPTGPGTGVDEASDGGRTQTLTPFTSLEDLKKSASGTSEVETEKGEETREEDEESPSLNRAKLQKLADRLDAESSASEQESAPEIELPETTAGSPDVQPDSVSGDREEAAEPEDGNESGAGSGLSVDTDDIDAESVAREDRRGNHREETGEPARRPAGADGEKAGSTGIDNPAEDRLDPGGNVDEEGLAIPEPGDDDGSAAASFGTAVTGPSTGFDRPDPEQTAARDVDDQAGDEPVPTERMEIPKPGGRDETEDEKSRDRSPEVDIEVPKPDGGPEQTAARDVDEGRPEGGDGSGHGLDAGEVTSASTPVRRVDWGELWDAGADATPKMAILNRSSGDAGEYKPVTRVELDYEGEPVVAVSEDDQRIVTGGEDGLMTVRDGDGEELYRFVVEGRQWIELDFLEGTRFWYGLGRDGQIDVWLAPEQQETGSIRHAVVGTPGARFLCGALDDGRRTLVVGTGRGVGYVWKLEEGECIARLEEHDAPITGVAFGQRGPVTAGRDGTIRFWNKQGLQIDQVNTSTNVRDLAACDGMLTWIEDQGAVVRMEEGTSEVTRLQGHFGEGTVVDVTDDEFWITGGDDGRMLVRRLEDQEVHQEIKVPSPVVRLAATSKRLVSVSPGGMIYIFERE